jgi:Ca2+/Na+ antiporter
MFFYDVNKLLEEPQEIFFTVNGDLLGTVLADATIVVGILALISPFNFPIKIIYVTGVFMVISSFLLFYFMKSGKTLTRSESFILFIFWIVFILTELALAS